MTILETYNSYSNLLARCLVSCKQNEATLCGIDSTNCRKTSVEILSHAVSIIVGRFLTFVGEEFYMQIYFCITSHKCPSGSYRADMVTTPFSGNSHNAPHINFG